MEYKKELIKAIKISIRVLEDQKRVFSFDTYLVERLGVNDPTAMRAKERNDELESAADMLRGLLDTLTRELELDMAQAERQRK